MSYTKMIHERAFTMSRGAISYSWLSAMLILGSLLGLFVLRSFGLTLRQTALLKMSEGALLKQVSLRKLGPVPYRAALPKHRCRLAAGRHQAAAAD